MKVGLKFKGKKILLDVKKCNFFQMGRGLMFKSRENAGALLFEGWKRKNMALTALFVFFPFIAIWLDSKNKIVDLKIVRPFTFFVDSKSNYKKIVEIPINSTYKKINHFLVGEKVL